MNNIKIKDLLSDYYQGNGFDDDGGESAAAVEIKMFKGVSIYLPNPETRKKAILKHDIHHMITGYKTNFLGETEISAWELSTGCRNNWIAFVLNTFAVTTGMLLFNFKGLWKAWVRGKHTQSLYYKNYNNDLLKEKSINEIKQELGFAPEQLDQTGSFGLFIQFLCFLIFAAVFSTVSMVLFPFIIIYTIIIYFRNNK